MDEDAPVEGAEVGRLIFTSRLRRAQRVERYEIGDLGRWVPGPCPCGRSQPRFELLGRFGDAFKVAAHFFNYRKLTHVLEERLGYSGMLQVRIVHRGIRELMTLRIEEGSPFTAEEVLGWLVKDDDNFRDATETIRVMDAEVEFAPPSAFVRSAQSGKLRPILDER
jgi:phenylacetate-coenzyme A ligase PaaK-like adenylate-forming protein